MAGDDSIPSDARRPAEPGPPADRSLDAVFELLANRRRRLAIYALVDAPDGVVGFDDLVSTIVRMEVESGHEPPDSDHRALVAADLRHWHLPVLADVDVIAYDDRSDVVRYGGGPRLERWVRRARREEGL